LTLALDEPAEADSVFPNGGVQYFIDKELLKTTGDVAIDFVEAGWRRGFTVSAQNPVGGAGSCAVSGGCGSQGSCS
jgi:Fe-S cluster assembly iron-binding protein IscA